MQKQTIHIHAKRNDPFIRVPKAIIEDEINLSWKAKCILTYLIGKPVGWKVRVADLTKRATDGKAAVRTGLKELRKAGYAKLAAIREGGRIVEWRFQVADCPMFLPETEKQLLENRDVENRYAENRYSSKNEPYREGEITRTTLGGVVGDTLNSPSAKGGEGETAPVAATPQASDKPPKDLEGMIDRFCKKWEEIYRKFYGDFYRVKGSDRQLCRERLTSDSTLGTVELMAVACLAWMKADVHAEDDLGESGWDRLYMCKRAKDMGVFFRNYNRILDELDWDDTKSMKSREIIARVEKYAEEQR